MTRRLVATLFVFCLVLSNNAFAQLKDNLELNLFGAGSLYTKNHYDIGFPQSATPIPGELKFDSHARFGLRLGVYDRGHWGQEFFYSFEPNHVHINRGGTAPGQTDLKIGIHNYGINALYYPVEVEESAINPFISAGIGGTLYSLSPEAVSFVTDPARGNMPDMGNANELGFNFGFGIKTHSAGPIGLRLDLRDFVGRSPSFGLARASNDPFATVLPATGVIHNGEFSVGVIFYFRKR